MNTTVKLHSLGARDYRTYIFSALFVLGNIILPQICHLAPNGGHIFLPIYFFTLIAAYKYGWQVGLLTAIASPLVNHFLFGMPPTAVLPSILIKSTLLAGGAAYAAHRFRSVSLLLLLAVVLFYQVAGSLIEGALHGSLAAGLVDFRLGLPGMAIQVIGGYLTLRYILNK
ncbi:MAG: ECF transporter S component [Muribaculaceae bacterium]|nr:ECF transporter S component [Muribaculaceae bacterium]